MCIRDRLFIVESFLPLQVGQLRLEVFNIFFLTALRLKLFVLFPSNRNRISKALPDIHQPEQELQLKA